MEDVTPREYFDTVMSVRQKMRRLRDPPTGEDVLNQMMAARASRDICYHPTPKSEVEEREEECPHQVANSSEEVMDTRYRDQPEVLRTETGVSEEEGEEEEELEERQPLLLDEPNLDQNGQPLYQTLASQVHMSSFVSSEEEEEEEEEQEEEEEEEETHHWMENAHQLPSTSMAAAMGRRRPVCAFGHDDDNGGRRRTSEHLEGSCSRKSGRNHHTGRDSDFKPNHNKNNKPSPSQKAFPTGENLSSSVHGSRIAEQRRKRKSSSEPPSIRKKENNSEETIPNFMCEGTTIGGVKSPNSTCDIDTGSFLGNDLVKVHEFSKELGNCTQETISQGTGSSITNEIIVSLETRNTLTKLATNMDSTNTNIPNEYLSTASPSTNFLPDDKQTNKREDKDEHTQISNVVIDTTTTTTTTMGMKITLGPRSLSVPLKERDASLKNSKTRRKTKLLVIANTLETPCDTFSPSSPPSSPQVLELETNEARGNYQYTSEEDDENEDEVCGSSQYSYYSNLNTESQASPSFNHQQKQMTQQPYCDSHFGDRDCQYGPRKPATMPDL